MRHFHQIFIFSALAAIFLTACGGGKETIAERKSEPDDYLLSKSSPEKFSFEVKDEGKYSFNIGVVYFSNQMQEFDVLKLQGKIKGGEGAEQVVSTEIAIKGEKGWNGTPMDDGKNDWLVEQDFAPVADLKPGKYTFTLMPGESENREIPGMVEFRLKVIKN